MTLHGVPVSTCTILGGFNKFQDIANAGGVLSQAKTVKLCTTSIPPTPQQQPVLINSADAYGYVIFIYI
jgi:hypothetical protein